MSSSPALIPGLARRTPSRLASATLICVQLLAIRCEPVTSGRPTSTQQQAPGSNLPDRTAAAPTVPDLSKFPPKQNAQSIPFEEITVIQGAFQQDEHGRPSVVPPRKVEVWTSLSDIEAIATRNNCIIIESTRSSGMYAKADPPVQSTRFKSRTFVGITDPEPPDDFLSIDALHTQGRCFQIALVFVTPKAIADANKAQEGDKNLRDCLLNRLRLTMKTQGSFLRRVMSSLISAPAARNRVTLLLDQLESSETRPDWIETLGSTASFFSADAQVDATFWFRFLLNCHNPIVSLSVEPMSSESGASWYEAATSLAASFNPDLARK